MSRSVLIIFNPASGAGNQQKVSAVTQALQDRGAQVEVYLTRCAGDATRYLQDYTGPLDIVAAAGGDGTVNEVINGLKLHRSYQLAIIPTGTTNVLAAELKFPVAAAKLADIILSDRVLPVYPGQINQRRFLLMAGIGYDAWVVDNVDLNLKKRVGKLAYVLSMLKQLRNFGKKRYRLVVDGKTYFANSVVITNGRYYGGSFVLSRKADLSHPTTQVLMISGRSPLRFLAILLGLPLGLIERMPGVVSVAATEITAELFPVPGQKQVREPVQADGDSVTELPLQLSMESQPISLLVGR